MKMKTIMKTMVRMKYPPRLTTYINLLFVVFKIVIVLGVKYENVLNKS